MAGLEEVLKRAAVDLDAVGARWAIIGGLAVATRAAPRFTQDVDFAVSVANDAEAEEIVHRMSVRGYAVGMMLEQDYVHRLATIRLIRPVPGKSQIFVDLLFGSSGIEDQVVACADRLEVWPHFSVPVARVGHLIALKLLSRDDRRLQDQLDLQALLAVATQADLEDARSGVALIVKAQRPIVVMDDPKVPDGASRVCFDLQAGAGQLADHLITLGHRTIAYLDSPAP